MDDLLLLDGQLNFLFENIEHQMISQIMERLDDMEYIINDDYKMLIKDQKLFILNGIVKTIFGKILRMVKN